MLVVRLHHSDAFEQDQLWRHAADFKTNAGRAVFTWPRLTLSLRERAG